MVAILAVAGLGVWWFSREPATSAPPIAGAVANFTLMDAPRPMPVHPFIDENGVETALSDFRGRVLLVNFWATWCAPCRVEMKSLDRLEAALGGDDFAVIPISLDLEGAEIVLPFYAEYGLDHLPVALNPKGEIGAALALTGLPTTIVVGRDGNGLGYMLGPAEWDSADAKALIEWFIEQRE
jgi:thiol-disulfide isomerase/thioredoxin